MNNNDVFYNNLEEKYNSMEWTYVYIKSISKYYWIENKRFLSVSDMCHNNMISSKEVVALRQFWLVQTYDDLTYKFWWEKSKFNLLDENIILKPSNTPILHNDIDELINNVCWWNVENIEYLHKSIYYKYLNINDVNIPAIIFHWAWWSGKWTLISLLETIYWKENVLKNLWQRDLLWNFDTYKWKKIIVEFAEISTWNRLNDLKIINKLKNIIWSNVIQVNDKWISSYEIDNIAWFFITSNSNMPIKLDSKESWNRRFNVIKSKTKLNRGEFINKTIRDKKIVSDYLAWLESNYWEVKHYKKLNTLENEDKKLLEDLSQDESNNFWDWLINQQPELVWNNIKNEDIQSLLKEYCEIFNKNFLDVSKYFWDNSRYERKKVRIWEKTYMGVKIT